MTPLVFAVVAAAMVEGGGTAIALDDGTVWIVYDGEWEELGGCEDGELLSLDGGGGELAIECGDGTAWTWSHDGGWAPQTPIAETLTALEHERAWARSWWPVLEVSARRGEKQDQPVYEGWVRLRWTL